MHCRCYTWLGILAGWLLLSTLSYVLTHLRLSTVGANMCG
eukprot:COSAG06_NODE_9259_length_1945_cov_1.411159_4_plen_39_part_01